MDETNGGKREEVRNEMLETRWINDTVHARRIANEWQTQIGYIFYISVHREREWWQCGACIKRWKNLTEKLANPFVCLPDSHCVWIGTFIVCHFNLCSSVCVSNSNFVRESHPLPFWLIAQSATWQTWVKRHKCKMIRVCCGMKCAILAKNSFASKTKSVMKICVAREFYKNLCHCASH